MLYNVQKKEWDTFCNQIIGKLSPVLKKLGYKLDTNQPNIIGERFLIKPITNGSKLVLIGRNINNETRVVIKVSADKLGVKEIKDERKRREFLDRIDFAHQILHSPKEILFVKENNLTISITEFIEQEREFISREISEQFTFILKTFKAQESAHATTSRHRPFVIETFGEMNAKDYIDSVNCYSEDILKLTSSYNEIYRKLEPVLNLVIPTINNNEELIEQYCGFLTHWDFTPQNLRIQKNKLFLLDHSSLRFGNKYESWARFINFMVLYNPPLASMLIKYVHDNRTEEESKSLRLMRLFRLVELIRYYTNWLSRTTDDLHELAKVRIIFWTDVLRATLDEKEVSENVIESYKKTRDKLRTTDEHHRQKDLH